MNKKIMVLWCIIIVGLLGIVLLLGLKQKDLAYIKLEFNIKIEAHKYIKDNNINIKLGDKYNIEIDKIINNKNIKIELVDKYCIRSIDVINNLVFNDYKLLKKCEK